jgi:peptidoglycan/xylan/chitin deacetylase (PgdA/CDA1 family)
VSSVRSCLTVACLVLVGLTAGATQNPPTPQARVALTFDDLPSHGALPAGVSRVDVVKSILATLKQYGAPSVYGFINAGKLQTKPEDEEVLRLWREAGYPLGNHAFTHMDLHANTLEAFERDVLANEASLRSLMGTQDWHWFRYPYLREGDTAEKYRGVRDMLAKQGYRVAQVTLDFSDYAYNEPYARCLARSDAEGLMWLEQSFMERAAASLTRGQTQAEALFGRDINHVMLLHVGAFHMVMLPRLMDLLKERRFALVTLDEAQSDAAYKTVPERESNWNGTLLDQMRTSKPQPPETPSPTPPVNTFQQLSALCK